MSVTRGAHSKICGDVPDGMTLGSNRGQIGVNVHTFGWSHGPATCMNSGFSGRWDRNRTCTLRLWSSPRSVHCCWRVSTDAEFYWLLHGGMSSCVHVCRHGLLSELLSIMKCVLREISRLVTIWAALAQPAPKLRSQLFPFRDRRSRIDSRTTPVPFPRVRAGMHICHPLRRHNQREMLSLHFDLWPSSEILMS
jgi:hypothetical protein